MINRGFIGVWLAAVLTVTLLHGSASAHTGIKGICVDCHTMHFSQDGVTFTPQPMLLRFSCVGCHANGSNGPNGRGTGVIPAPQIHDPTTPLSGGYFSPPAGDNAIQHNVYDLGLPVDSAFSNVPGSVVPYNAGSQISCTDCHDASIGHASADSARLGTATSSYRMLGRGGAFYVKGTGDVNFGANDTQSSIHNQYHSGTLDMFCASCHGLFHSLNQGIGEDPLPNMWLRHPTDVSLKTEYTGSTFTGSNTVPLGYNDSRTDMVMCISCHRPHGSPYKDLLRFNYSLVNSGDASATTGCEDCHGAK